MTSINPGRIIGDMSETFNLSGRMIMRSPFIAFLAAWSLAFANPAAAQQSSPQVSIVQNWLGSGHADAESSSFTHWSGEQAIPGTCATCHSGVGFRDFFGVDGSAPGSIDHPVVPGGVVDCETCHNDVMAAPQPITFPSGITVTAHGSVATCMTCHQGRQSGPAVARATAGTEDDAINPDLGFINPHYAPAAAVQMGAAGGGGFQYSGMSYVTRFTHVPSFAQCTDCHDPHSLEIEVETCARCHGSADLRDIRTTMVDFDGDGHISSGIYAEIATLSKTLMDAIGTYSVNVTGAEIAYADRHPYFFHAEGSEDAGSAYTAWTPRLLRAAYNYKFVTSDPGAYAHNPRYAIQLLHDSITDLADAMGQHHGLGPRPQ